MTTHNYSADSVELNWNDLDLTDGLGQGTFITETEGPGGWTTKENAKGNRVYRVFNPSKMGQVSILVDQESLVHQQLLAAYNLDSSPATRTQVALMLLTDKSSGEEISFVNAFISKRPNVARGVEGGTVPWVFMYERKEQEAITTLASTVGD